MNPTILDTEIEILKMEREALHQRGRDDQGGTTLSPQKPREPSVAPLVERPIPSVESGVQRGRTVREGSLDLAVGRREPIDGNPGTPSYCEQGAVKTGDRPRVNPAFPSVAPVPRSGEKWRERQTSVPSSSCAPSAASDKTISPGRTLPAAQLAQARALLEWSRAL